MRHGDASEGWSLRHGDASEAGRCTTATLRALVAAATRTGEFVPVIQEPPFSARAP